jgi:hypothetical protein
VGKKSERGHHEVYGALYSGAPRRYRPPLAMKIQSFTSLLGLFALAACANPPKTRSTGSSSGACVAGSCKTGSPCDPNLATDACATGGLACTIDYTDTSPTGAYCELPGPYFSCLPAVGCASSSLQCVGADGGTPGNCLAPCASTADCSDPVTFCAALVAEGPTYCLINLCIDFWQSCDASAPDAGDGTCVYLYNDPQYGPQGGCLQGGSVPATGACSYYRASGAALCAPGTLCMVDSSGANAGICMTDCDGVADGGPECTGVCVLQEPPSPPPAVSAIDFNQAGGCAVPCTSGGNGCPASLTCYEVGTGSGVYGCLP